MTSIFLLKDKATIGTILPYFCQMISTQFGSPIQKLRTNNARDYFNHHLHQFFKQGRIVYESSYIDIPQQNGVAERKMRHFLNIARSLLHHHRVPKNF